ncbi:hypothetical protein [Sphingomonas sp. S1-29]|uniref:hypothetical protein n=1 Tax=Sphingomonas sp. S1-29 TaxID=2991074 RepID=UPI002AD3DF40|nr:hypothetical protein [Sphingomonas sp. S1-29]
MRTIINNCPDDEEPGQPRSANLEPRDVHHYQPGWTMVGAGGFDLDLTSHSMASVVPKGVKSVKDAVATFLPAAVRKQAPIVAINLLATLAGKPLVAGYDGYGFCLLTVERGKIVLAEFGYGGKLLPSFPKWLIDGT